MLRRACGILFCLSKYVEKAWGKVHMKKIMDDKILAYIETHLDMEYGQDDIAEAFGYSTDHFRHLFRMYYDMPLGEYIQIGRASCRERV